MRRLLEAIAIVIMGGSASMCPRVEAGKPAWVELAEEAALVPAEVIEMARRHLAAMPAGARRRAETLLDGMAHVPLDGDGVRSAYAQLTAALPGFVDPKSKVSGDSPDVADVKQCSLVLLHGLLARAGHAARKAPGPVPAAVELVRAAETIDLFGKATHGSLQSELRLGLGGALYDEALKQVEAEPKK
jgi:hypothetical protein